MLKDKNIVLGITGGIAAYKGAEIVSRLKKEGANVNVVMTKNACEFITPLTLRTLSKNEVITDMFEAPKTFDPEHISLAREADLLLVAPATANILGKVANGIADDMLSTTIMATKAPVVFALAMNENMLDNAIVQENIEKLERHGYKFIDSTTGMLACGIKGKGRLAKPENIVETVKEMMESSDSNG